MKYGGDLLSREVLKQLGVLPPDFSKVGQFSSGQVETGGVDKVSVGGDEDKKTGEQGLDCFNLPVSVILRVNSHAGAH